MRQFDKALFILASFSCASASAQIINGSFEQDGAPSLAGWEWTCAEPGLPNEAAPSCGEWCATKGPGEAKGCFPSYIFQRLPDVVDGETLTLSGWIRCSDNASCVGGFMGLARLNSGVITTADMIGSSAPWWGPVSITQTAQLGPGDTAIVALYGGFVGGPTFPAPSFFDGIVVEIITGIGQEERSASPLFQLAPDGRHIAVHASANDLVLLHDMVGRLLHQSRGSSSGLSMVDLPEGTGCLVVTVQGNGTQRSQRLVLQP
ncbi:MAG: hypothetical protein ABI432_17690 [Flavobacteriales bacterium]